MTTIERASALEDAPNRANTRQRLWPNTSSHEFPVNGHGSKFSQGALVLQLAPDLKHQLFEAGIGPVRRDVRAVLAIREIDALKALLAGAPDPPLNMRQRHVELSGDLPHRSALPDSANHLSAPFFVPLF
jgi:hypothetical protein